MSAPTIGVEEEFFLVDADGLPMPVSRAVLSRLDGATSDHTQHELQRSQIETETSVCRTLADVNFELRQRRRDVAKAAGAVGARLASSGSLPTGPPAQPQVTPKRAYIELERDYQQLTREQHVCGCHVHIGIDDPELAIDVLNRSRPWLPAVLALSTNSPFWDGVDTGYASYRHEVWSRWPVSGIPEPFSSRADYEDAVSALVDTGAVDASARLYWDVRPSARYPTLEFRVADACLTVEDTLVLAGVIRALVMTCAEEAGRGVPASARRYELVRAAAWRAARYGLGADLIDVAGRQAAPARDVVDAFLAHLRPALESAGDWQLVAAGVTRMFDQGTGAVRQRKAFSERGRTEDVVDFIVEQTAA
ncbi:MAG: glutamate--cysteine ligase [Acidimicrobiia bacterium]|nr:glutamate--cysteine ligase [Acidimicrobiia bacterium]